MAYGKIHETFWDDQKLRQVSEGAVLMLAYLISCRHRNRLGCYVLDPYYAAADLRWNVEKVDSALTELESVKRIAYDRATRVVFVRNFLKYNTLENAKVVTGACSDLASIPDTPLLSDLLAVLECWQRPHYHAVISALRNRIANGIANGSGIDMAYRGPGHPLTITIPVTVTETEKEKPPIGGQKKSSKESGNGKRRGPLGHFAPDDFTPTEAHRIRAAKLGLDTEIETEKFKEHEFKDARSDWNRAFFRWMRTAVEMRGNRAPPGTEADRVRRGGPDAEMPGRRTSTAEMEPVDLDNPPWQKRGESLEDYRKRKAAN